MTDRAKAVLAGVVTAGALALAGCGGGGEEETCIILTNGGNKLCGADAATWCETTDPLREAMAGLGADAGAPSVDTAIRQAQRDCATIQAEYGS